MLAFRNETSQRRVVLDFNQSIAERIGEKRTQEFIHTMTEIGHIISEQK